MKRWGMIVVVIGGTFTLLSAVLSSMTAAAKAEWVRPLPVAFDQVATPVITTFTILVDDFRPQPVVTNPVYFYNRLGGDRGALNNSILNWGLDQVTMTVAPAQTWGGVWTSLNHPIVEAEPVNFSAVLPAPISAPYQSQITGISLQIQQGTSGRPFRVELKNGPILWSHEVILTGGAQTVATDLPVLTDVVELVWVLDQAVAGDYVVIDHLSFTATTAITDEATAAFVWSYGMLLNNWNPATGLVRDKASDPSGAFDAVQATGSLAAATAAAQQLGILSEDDAGEIINQISHTLIISLPRYHGLWPHWVEMIEPSGTFTIAVDTEWSSVDTAIAAIGLLEAQEALHLDTASAISMLQGIDWSSLTLETGISHGYSYTGELITHTWDTFGGESWLLALAFAAANGSVPPMQYPSPPTANGSGFIDELAWLFVMPPAYPDVWDTDWPAYREAAVYSQTHYYPTHYPDSCFTQLGLFGLSAAEGPDPSMVEEDQIYQPFGIGGRFSPPNDGADLLGAPVVVPHYSAMVAQLRPSATLTVWTWLINDTYFSPLNNIESLMFLNETECDAEAMVWNHLKGSWNLALQALGWGNYLALRNRKTPILWQAAMGNTFLRHGYELLTPPLFLPVVMKS